MERIKNINISHIESLFKNTDSQEISVLGLSLIKELKFMKKTMSSLKKEINEKGVVVSMPQGNYDIERSNPALASYNTMIKNYNSTIKQIYDLLNTTQPNEEDYEKDNLSDY